MQGHIEYTLTSYYSNEKIMGGGSFLWQIEYVD
jgi:hypothetical protein